MQVQWYPGHMTKTRRQLEDRLGQVQIVIDVLDARAPAASSNPDLQQLVSGKKVLHVLNKADLADPQITAQWIRYFAERDEAAIPYSVPHDKAKLLKEEIVHISEPLLVRYEEKGVRKILRGLVAGVPNVGKSAILNRLLGTRRMEEGNRPGVTRSLQWAKIDPYLEILDSPGLLWPKFEDEKVGAVLALLGSVRREILDEEELACYLIRLLKGTDPDALTGRYGITDLEGEPYEILEAISRRRGFLLRGGDADTERGARTLLDEFRSGKLGRVSLEKPPR
ncbi:MAG: ribosome biogenesis GTPase YlqF [Clostridia bacterium]|nr:ribosome biogenesis GTPase YlqF [Clostridia bacterium]